MSRIEEVRSYYERFDWRHRGDYWATRWGGTQMQWYATILPRIACFLPTATILEIGSGPGRLSELFLPHAERLILTDLAEPCVQSCNKRFRDHPQVSAHPTDGLSLPQLAAGSVTFVFSFFSLVHADPPTMAACLGNIAHVLAPDGAAFLHHSNAGACTTDSEQQLRTFNDRSTSADMIAQFARDAGLWTRSQELFSWEGDVHLTDCFSVIARTELASPPAAVTVENWEFGLETRRARAFSQVYQK